MKEKLIYGLSRDVFIKMLDVFKEYSHSIKEVILFGSRARGDYKPTSDVDLAIKFRSDSGYIYKIKDRLENENVIYTFDIIDYAKIGNERLKSCIESEGEVIFVTDAKGEEVWSMNKIMYKLSDLEKAVRKLHESLGRDYTKDDIVIDATIQRFEFTYELSWKLMKAYLEYNGNLEATSPRKAIREAFREGMIAEGEAWLKMLEDRNRTSHTYDEATALEIYMNIKNQYAGLFDALISIMNKELSEQKG